MIPVSSDRSSPIVPAEEWAHGDPVIAFRAICNFIKDLNFAFGQSLPPLQLYAHLLDKTGLMNEEPIRKHVRVFRDFVTLNEEAICQKSVSLLQDHHVIKYSEKVFVDLNAVIQLAGVEDLETVWTHLLTILAVFYPQSQARSILKQEKLRVLEQNQKRISDSTPPAGGGSRVAPDPMEGLGSMMQTIMGMMTQGMGGGGGGEGGGAPDLSALMGSLGMGLDPSAVGGENGTTPPNPMEMMGNMMKSPLVANMMKSLNDGNIDMPKIVEGMQKTLDTLQTALSEVGTNAAAAPVQGEGASPQPQPPTPEVD